MGPAIGGRPWSIPTLLLLIAALLWAGSVGVASAATGGAPIPASAPPLPGSPSGTPVFADPSAGALSLISAQTSPHRSFYDGFRDPQLTFAIASTQAENDLQIDVVDSAGTVIRTYYRSNVAPEVATTIRWDGNTAQGQPAPNGEYSFRIAAQSGAVAAAAKSTNGSRGLSFSFYGYEFPVLGAHDYGTAANRFGAPRAGHTHQGQDVLAACGTPLVAARGGRVQYAGYEANAGNHLVIDGKGTGMDFMYAHLAEPSPLQTGDPVRTGQPIGVVGETGDATGCHLHFEIWTPPGWYQGGSPIDPLPFLERWDAYS